MASVNAEVTVLTRAADPTRHLLEVDYDATFQLTTTDTTYSTDTSAFATTVYNYYNAELTNNTATSQVSTVECRLRVWVGGTAASGGGSPVNDLVLNPPATQGDLQAQLNTHIAYALTGDVVAPGS